MWLDCHRDRSSAARDTNFGVKTTILRSRESVVKATSLLGRTLRRASRAGSERQCPRGCARARVWETASRVRSRHPHSGRSGGSSGSVFSHDYGTTVRLPRKGSSKPRLGRPLGSVRVLLHGDLPRIYRRPRRPRRDAQKLSGRDHWSTQVTLPRLSNPPRLCRRVRVICGVVLC